jgi:membrane protein
VLIKKYCQQSLQKFTVKLSCQSFYILRALLKDIQDNQLNLRAMSLVFTTFLSLVPLLAFSFSVLKAFGVHNQMEPMLLQLLEPLGSQGIQITVRIVEFVANMKVAVMGAFGLLILIFTIVSLTHKVEEAFNFTWQVETSRNFMERFSHYISIIVVGPILMFSALALSASFMNTEFIQQLSAISPFGHVIASITKNAPILLIIMAFSFSYWFIPNTPVSAKAALVGGIIAGSLWQLAGWAFASYVAASSGQTAIYSVFASLFFFFIWMYVGWMVLLVGSRIAYYSQYPDYARYRHYTHHLASKDQERLSLAIMQAIAQRHYQQDSPYNIETLQQHFNVPIPLLHTCLQLLIFHKFISLDQQQPAHYLLIRSLSDTRIDDILKAIRTGNAAQIKTAQGISHQLPPRIQDTSQSLRSLVQEKQSHLS